MKRLALIGLFGWLFLLCGPDAQANASATLKLRVQLNAGVIKVSDLWSSAGASSDTVIGPAPPPGRSIIVEAAQLAYIARLYDVDWQPVSGAERTSIERAGRPLTRQEMTEPLLRSLVDAGAATSSTIELTDFVPPLVPSLSVPWLSVESLSYDPGSERFYATVAVSGPDMPTERMHLAGRVLNMVPAVVATRKLQPGDLIGPADVRGAEIPERGLASPIIANIALVLGQSPKRTIVAGQPLSSADVGPPTMVSKGDTVVVTAETSGLYLAVQGLALASGGQDDAIQIMNPLSHAVIVARVTAPGRAIIAPGTSPLVAPRNGAPRHSEVTN